MEHVGNTYTLRKVNVYPMVINQHPLHLEVGLLASFLVLKLDERILQAVACSFISNNLTRQNSAKTTEDQMQILICHEMVVSLEMAAQMIVRLTLGNRIEFANK